MATLVKTYTQAVNQAAGSPPTCFGLPGSSGGNAAWMNVSLTLTVYVYDNYDVAVMAKGTISKQNILAADYPSILVVNASNWDWSYSGGSIVVPSSAGTLASETIVAQNEGVGRGNYTWNIDTGMVPCGKLQDFGGTGTGTDGILYLSGTGTYHVNDPIYPTPVSITIPGFLEYIGYFPWSRMQDGVWKSCNRDGGRLYRRAGGAWADMKNTEQGSESDKVFYRTSGTWERCPKIGVGAQ